MKNVAPAKHDTLVSRMRSRKRGERRTRQHTAHSKRDERRADDSRGVGFFMSYVLRDRVADDVEEWLNGFGLLASHVELEVERPENVWERDRRIWNRGRRMVG